MSREQDVLHRETGALRRTGNPLQRKAELRRTHPEGLWDRGRNSFDQLVEGGQWATERVVASFEGLGDAVRVRVEKGRLERTLLKKCAELGTRVYALAKEPGLADGRRPQVLDDDSVKALLQEVGCLDAELQKAAGEPPERLGRGCASRSDAAREDS
jgi:hypothetical protein